MPYGERVGNLIGSYAEGDKTFEQSVYTGPSGALTFGMPLFKDLTDAAEFNARFASTALVPATSQTGGRVVLANSALTNVNAFMGIFAPSNPADLPNNGDIIRVLIFGEGIVAAISQTGNANALTVGSLLTVIAAQPYAVAGGATPVARQTVGIVLATRGGITLGSTPSGGGAGANAATLLNAFVAQS